MGLYVYLKVNHLYILKQYKTISFNILVPTIYYLTSNHWHQKLKEKLCAVNEILQKIDPQEYNNALDTENQIKSDKNLRITMPPEERSKLDQK